MAAATAMEFAHHRVTVKHHSCFQQRWQGQFGYLSINLVSLRVWQLVDSHHLDGKVVLASLKECFINDGFGGLLQVSCVPFDGGQYEIVTDMLVDAVGNQQKGVVL